MLRNGKWRDLKRSFSLADEKSGSSSLDETKSRAFLYATLMLVFAKGIAKDRVQTEVGRSGVEGSRSRPRKTNFSSAIILRLPNSDRLLPVSSLQYRHHLRQALQMLAT